MGILGALDPYKHKLNSKQLELKGVVTKSSADVGSAPQVNTYILYDINICIDGQKSFKLG